jgi:hypothetical protein
MTGVKWSQASRANFGHLKHSRNVTHNLGINVGVLRVQSSRGAATFVANYVSSFHIILIEQLISAPIMSTLVAVPPELII